MIVNFVHEFYAKRFTLRRKAVRVEATDSQSVAADSKSASRCRLVAESLQFFASKRAQIAPESFCLSYEPA